MYSSKWIKRITFMLLAVMILGVNQSVFAQSSNPVPVGIFNENTISPAARLEIPIEIKNVNGLYALDIALTFDPTLLVVEDADPSNPGVQMALGKFLDPGMVLYNTVDNAKGTAHFVMTQANPSEPKTGSGTLLVVYFKALKAGDAPLTFTNVQLSTRDGVEISSSKMDSVIHVKSDAPVVEATSIPVQAPETLIQIPTEMPTATSTVAPTPIPTPTLLQSNPKGISESVNLPSAQEDQHSGFSSLASWWIVLILLVLVIGAAVLLFITRKKNK